MGSRPWLATVIFADTRYSDFCKWPLWALSGRLPLTYARGRMPCCPVA
jgi:hypothetical protein